MTTAKQLDGDYELSAVSVGNTPVDDVSGRLILSAADDARGSFVSESNSEFGEQVESGAFQLEPPDVLIISVLESTHPSMVGAIMRLRFTLEGNCLILRHLDEHDNAGALSQRWERRA